MPFGGPLEVLEVLTPVMSITTLLLSLATEQLWNTLPGSPYFSSLEHILFTLLVIFVGAVIAFLMVWTEYQVGAKAEQCKGCSCRGYYASTAAADTTAAAKIIVVHAVHAGLL
eukprot:GHRR01028062.1.p1 GENE.GHRR01028062.1~~GHRR01028062.1.p1  ORF type:complete len:113 (+),score=35.66 GHRR01028062.1:377-715(+)